MCGIAGFVGTVQLQESTINQTLSKMTRRGPDNLASKQFSPKPGWYVHLLHSRLSIIDLDPRANQPFYSCKRWTAYNGELYNYLELRNELESKGRNLTTSSDTEVLLQAIDEWGWLSALDRCEGMWAFATYDERDGSITLCRDRFGEKPLYLYQDERGLFFGSEIKFLAELSGKRFDVDKDQIQRYLVNGYKSLYKVPGRTFFKNVTELSPGVCLTVTRDGERRSAAYYEIKSRQEQDMSREEAVKGARERLIRSVELRLRADVPLAFCMSGGVDSNSLIAIAKRTLGYDVHGFTIMNTDARYEESDMIHLAVKDLGIKHTPSPVNQENFLQGLKELVKQHDAPVYTISYYLHWQLMQAVHNAGYRISVSGTGADELFSGYYDHHLMYLAASNSDPVWHAQALAGWAEKVKPFVRNPFLSTANLFVGNESFREHIYLDASGFEQYLTTHFHEPFSEHHFSDNLLRNRMLNELTCEAVPVILHEDDLNGMHYSVENRSPYLDRALFEFTSIIPTRHLIHNGYAKSILRDAVRGIAPDAVIDNYRKVGFNAPILELLQVNDPAIREQLLAPSPVWELIRKEKIAQLLDRGTLPNSQSKFLFYFVNVKLFLEEFYQ